MSLRTLWPNRTLLWKEWHNTLTVTTLFFGFTTYAASYTLLNEIMLFKDLARTGDQYWMHFTTMDLLGHDSSKALVALVSVLFLVALGAGMIGLERSHDTFDLLLAMPYSRRQVMHNKFLFGLGVLAAVFVANALLMTLLVTTNPGIPFPFEAAHIWVWAWRTVLVLAFVFAFTLLISSASGTILGNVFMSVIFLAFPLGVTGLVAMNVDFLNLPLHQHFEQGIITLGGVLTVPSYIMGYRIYEDYSPAYVYPLLLLAILGVYLLTQYVFARNHMENNGEVLMFSRLEGIFKLGVAVCFALLVVPIALHQQRPELPAALVAYLVVGAVFWLLVSWVINVRRKI